MIVTLDQVIAGVLEQVLYLLFPFCNTVEELLTLSLVMMNILGPVKQTFECKNVITLLAINLNMCFGYSKER